MSYKLIETDTLSEAIENAFQRGRAFQSNRDEDHLFSRIEQLKETVSERIDEDNKTPEDGWYDGLHELKDVISDEFEEDANFMGFIERERTISSLTPDSDDVPSLHDFQAKDKLDEIRAILANPEMYSGEYKEKLELIVDIICRD